MSTRKNDTATIVSADAAYTLIPILNAQLKSMASAAMWPSHIIDAIFVDYQDDDLIVDYPDNLGDEIDDLEYGSGTQLPNPVVRPFVARCGQIIKNTVGAKTIDEILILEDVFNG
jgi:hypothetical protein